MHFFSKKTSFHRPLTCLAVIALTVAAPSTWARDTSADRIRLLEQKLQAIQIELERVKSESSQATQKVNTIQQKTDQTEQKVTTLEQKKVQLQERVGSDVTEKSRMLFFRGGWRYD